MPKESSRNEDEFPRDKSLGDAAYSVVKAGISAIPLAGAPASELLQFLVTPALQKRREAWFESVGHRLNELEQNEGISLEDLRENEAFIDTVMMATQVALRTSQEEKKQALKNAIVNAALSEAPDLALQQMFINYVDAFTVWHIRLLELFSDPPTWARRRNHQFPNLSMGGLSDIIESAFPQLKAQRDLYDQIWKDLYSRGLTNTENLHVSMTGSGLMAKRVSALGEQFIAFVSE